MKKVKKKKRSLLSRLKYKLFNNTKKKNIKDTNKSVSINNNMKKNKTNKEHTSKIKKEKTKRKFWKRLITFILILGIVGVLSIAAFFAFIVLTSPEFKEEAFDTQEESVLYDINGDIITTLGIEKRENVSYDDLPQVLIDAIIATEDSRFFQHNGLDLLRFAKATIQQLLGNGDAGGASTLTMQIVKNNLTKQGKTESNTIEKLIRKFQDIYLAVFKVEKEYSKEEIIEFYVNDNGLGSSAYGVQTASKYYFGKDVSELTLPEAAMIAGLFQSPNYYNPYYQDVERITKRRNLVLKLMYNHGYITEEEMEIASNVKIEDMLVGLAEDGSKYQGYIDTVLDELDTLGYNPYETSIKVYTTMEPSIQLGMENVMKLEGSTYWEDDTVQAGIAVVNAETGAIAAVGAGRNRTGERTFNFATQSKRQPGSTAKPLFDYGPGIEYNNFSSYQLFYDEEWTYTNGPAVNNWDGDYKGLVTMRYALQFSRNVPALKAYQMVGGKNIQAFVSSLGLDVALNESSENYRIVNEYTGVDNTINEAYSIGGVAEGFTPLEMAAAYAAFASGGYYTDPYTITKIEIRKTGEVKEYNHTRERVMKDSTAYIMNNILESAVNSGFNGGAYVSGSHVAAKTGTSNYDDATMKKYNLPSYAVNDLWTVAYTSKYSIAVWYGHDEVSSTSYNRGGSYKENITREAMKYIPKDTTGWSMPSSVVAATVEVGTWPAQLASEYTPSNMKTTEYFVKGTQPTEVSTRFAKLDDITNLNIKTNSENITLTWEYTIPESLDETYLKEYFSQSIFGKGTNTLIENRLNGKETFNANKLNNPSLESLGFGIYEEQEDGTLKEIDFVTEPKYVYTGDKDVTLVIKEEFKDYKTNASSGVKAEITIKKDNTKITATLSGKTTYTLEKNTDTYKEEGFKSILYGTKDVTDAATIEYSIDEQKFASVTELEEYINNVVAGTYKITYTITYKKLSITKTRTVIIKENKNQEEQ